MAVDPSADVHPTAIIADGASIGPGARIGPYCVIGEAVDLGASVDLKSHVVVEGKTRVGDGTVVFPFAVLGHIPQDLKFKGERTTLEIGARNRIREHVTMHPGTGDGGGITRVGDDGLFMASCHVAHDCHVGNGVILANNVALAGHVVLEDNVIIGGNAAVQQRCRIGRGAMIGGLSGVVGDVIPYGTTAGERAHLAGLNFVGLKRRGVERAEMAELRTAFAELFGENDMPFADRIDGVAERFEANPLVQEIIRFIRAETGRHYVLPV